VRNRRDALVSEDAAGNPGDMAERRAAVAELGAEVRALVDAVVSTEVDPAELRACAERVRALTAALRRRRRTRGTLASVDDLPAGIRMFNPVSGVGNPYAPPMQMERDGGVAEGGCTLGLGYEGPPTYGHGGVSAMLLDQILGGAVASGGRPGMTTMLALRYRRPVPLHTPLRVRGEVTEVDGRRTRARGTLVTGGDPDRVLVAAEAEFISINGEQAIRLFGDAARQGARP
jgi:hypothetical protein